MALAIHISSFVSGGYTNPIRWDLYEEGTGTFIDSHTEPGAHGQVYNFSFVNNIRDVVYRIEMYDVPDGATVGNLIKSHNVTVTTSSVTVADEIELIVGGPESYDPVAGTDSVTIPALINQLIRLERRDEGQLFFIRDVEYSFDSTTGEITLLGGRQFGDDGERWIVHIKAQFIVNPPGTVNAGIFKAVELKIEDYTIVSEDFGKLLIGDGLTSVLTFTLPEIADMVEGVPVWVESLGTTHNNLVVQAATDEVIYFFNSSKNKMYLGKGESAYFVRKGNKVYGFCQSIDIKRVSQSEWGRYIGLNRLVANGAEYNQADYPRVIEALNALPAGHVLSTYAFWNTSETYKGQTVYPYRGLFAMYDDKFRVPDLMNTFIRSLKNIGGADSSRSFNIPGGWQGWEIEAHSHDLITGGNTGAADPGSSLNRRAYNGDGYDEGNSTSGPYVEVVGGVETRPGNTGFLPLIII